MLWYNAGMKANALFCSAVCCCAALSMPCEATPSDSGMFPFVIRPDVAGTAADMSALLEAPAGKCWALDEAGAHRDEVPVEVCGGKAQVCVGPAFRTIWYEIEVVR